MQLNAETSLAYAIGYLVGLQKHPEVKAIIEKQLGGEGSEKFVKDLFQIAVAFYPE